MSEYMKKKKTAQTEQTKKTEALDPRQEMTNGIPNSVLQEIFAGTRKADASMLGTSETLAPSIAAKMSRAFGMDVSGVKISRSKDMAGTGMRGLAQGNRVILSPDVDLNTLEGQAILGHELSHIHAQAQGIGMGHAGLLQDASLERQADMEGMRAARGLSITQDTMDMGMGMNYGFGMQGVEGIQPLTGGISASASAPMQASLLDKLFGGKKKKEAAAPQQNNVPQISPEEEAATAAETKFLRTSKLTKYDANAEKKANENEAKNKGKKGKTNPYRMLISHASSYLASMKKAVVQGENRDYTISKAKLQAIRGIENIGNFQAVKNFLDASQNVPTPDNFYRKVTDDIAILKNTLRDGDGASFEAQRTALNNYINPFLKELEEVKASEIKTLITNNRILLNTKYDDIMRDIKKEKDELNREEKGSTAFNICLDSLKQKCASYDLSIDSGTGTLEMQLKEFTLTAGKEPKQAVVKKETTENQNKIEEQSQLKQNTGEQKTGEQIKGSNTNFDYGEDTYVGRPTATEEIAKANEINEEKPKEENNNQQSVNKVMTKEEREREEYNKNFGDKKKDRENKRNANENNVSEDVYILMQDALRRMNDVSEAKKYEYDRRRKSLVEFCTKHHILAKSEFDENGDLISGKIDTEGDDKDYKKKVANQIRRFLLKNRSDKITRMEEEERRRKEEEANKKAAEEMKRKEAELKKQQEIEQQQSAKKAEAKRRSVPTLGTPSKKDVAGRMGIPAKKVDVARYINAQISGSTAYGKLNTMRTKQKTGNLTLADVEELIRSVSATLRLTGTEDKGVVKSFVDLYVEFLDETFAAHPDWDKKPYYIGMD